MSLTAYFDNFKKDSHLHGDLSNSSLIASTIATVLGQSEATSLMPDDVPSDEAVESIHLEYKGDGLSELRICYEGTVLYRQIYDDQYVIIACALSTIEALYTATGHLKKADSVFSQISWRFTDLETLPVLVNDFDEALLDKMEDEEEILTYTFQDVKEWKSTGVTLVHHLLRKSTIEFQAEKENPFPQLFDVVLAGCYLIFNVTFNYPINVVSNDATDVLITKAYSLRSDGKASDVKQITYDTQSWQFEVEGDIWHASVLGVYK